MSIKPTKRKGFNFYRSYFDVFNELSDKDKLTFIKALLDRQFLGVEPEYLSGLPKFSYLSQKHSIDRQVKGYEDKTGTKLTENQDIKHPMQDPTEGGRQGPCQQEKEKEKEKVKYIVEYFNKITNKQYRLSVKTTDQVKARLNDGFTIDDFKKVINTKYNEWKDDPKMSKFIRPETLFGNKFEGYLNQHTTKPKPKWKDLTIGQKLAIQNPGDRYDYD